MYLEPSASMPAKTNTLYVYPAQRELVVAAQERLTSQAQRRRQQGNHAFERQLYTGAVFLYRHAIAIATLVLAPC
jgi:hypothetical protein